MADRILIAFRGYNGEGNNLFLDNIRVSVYDKTDVAVCSIVQPAGNDCEGSISPQILLKNTGINTISTCHIGYQIDGGVVHTFPVTANIPSNDSFVLNLPVKVLQTAKSFHILISCASTFYFQSILTSTLPNLTRNLLQIPIHYITLTMNLVIRYQSEIIV